MQPNVRWGKRPTVRPPARPSARPTFCQARLSDCLSTRPSLCPSVQPFDSLSRTSVPPSDRRTVRPCVCPTDRITARAVREKLHEQVCAIAQQCCVLRSTSHTASKTMSFGSTFVFANKLFTTTPNNLKGQRLFKRFCLLLYILYTRHTTELFKRCCWEHVSNVQPTWLRIPSGYDKSTVRR